VLLASARQLFLPTRAAGGRAARGRAAGGRAARGRFARARAVRGTGRGRAARSLARAAAEVGVALTLLTLATGSLWGAMAWGTWWAWDARIITTVGMGLVYIAYLTLDGLVRGRQGSRILAAVGIAGFLTVPLVHFSVLWW